MDKGKDVYINVNSSTLIKVLIFIVLFWLLFFVWQTVLVFLAAVVIASAIEPLVTLLEKKRIPRLGAVFIVYGLLIAVFTVVFYFLLPPLISDIASLLNNLPRYIDYEVLGDNSSFLGFRSALQTFTGETTFTELIAELGTLLATGQAAILHVVTRIFGGAMSLVLIFILSFYLSAQANGIERFLQLVTPREHEVYIVSLWRRTQRKIGFWLQGQLLLGLVVGVMVFIVLSILGVRHAFLLAFLAALLEIIPVFGPIISAIPAVAIGIIDGGVTSGFLVAAAYIIIQQLESNVIYPLVVKKIVGVPPLLVILSLVIGFQLGGLLGAILAVPIATAFVEYIDDVQKRRVMKQEALSVETS
jgi:predicted PurR-regulated permease PerM